MLEPKALLFDFGGTLDSDGVNWFTRLHVLVVKRGVSMDWDTFERIASQAADHITTMQDTCQLSMDQLAYRLVAQIHKQMSPNNGASHWDPADVADEFIAQAGVYLQRNRQLLTELAQTYRLGCISNNWGNTAGWCRQFNLDDLFETIIDSTVVGASKPDTAIFHAALQQLNLPPEQCAYIGDWFPADIVGANRAGLTTIWLTHQQTPCPDESIVDYRMTQLNELLTLDFK